MRGSVSRAQTTGKGSGTQADRPAVLGLDTLPLLIGVATYILFWPGKYITPATKVVPNSTTSSTPDREPGSVEESERGAQAAGQPTLSGANVSQEKR